MHCSACVVPIFVFLKSSFKIKINVFNATLYSDLSVKYIKILYKIYPSNKEAYSFSHFIAVLNVASIQHWYKQRAAAVIIKTSFQNSHSHCFILNIPLTHLARLYAFLIGKLHKYT